MNKQLITDEPEIAPQRRIRSNNLSNRKSHPIKIRRKSRHLSKRLRTAPVTRPRNIVGWTTIANGLTLALFTAVLTLVDWEVTWP
jgi:hypothetical protein